QFRLQESKVKPVLPTHFHLQDEIPRRIFSTANSHKDTCWPGWQTFCVTDLQLQARGRHGRQAEAAGT
ncbi:hypothetical protein LEMLEM_LOCUS4437, partial [Lemmus lemmus]